MTDEEFEVFIARGAEQRNVEFKGPGPISDNQLLWRVVRAMLGMANRQDGGYVIIGVNEAKGGQDPVRLDPVGVDLLEISGWTRDILADKVAPLVDPSVDFDVEYRTYQSKRFVLVIVYEFDESPVFCRSDKPALNGKGLVLREGALYVRGRRKPETVEIRTSQEMRDLLNLANTKNIRRYLEQTQAIGLPFRRMFGQKSSSELFRDQLSDLEL